MGITDMIALLVEARRMSTKHNQLQNALARIEIMHQGLEKFNKLFQPLFQKGLPEFWGPDGKLIPQGKYLELLNQERVNHAKFEGMDGGIKGGVVVNKLSEEFELLNQLRMITYILPTIIYNPLIDLEVVLKELFEMTIPTDQLWEDIHRLSSQRLAGATSS